MSTETDTDQEMPSPEVVNNPLRRFKEEYPFTFAVLLFEGFLVLVAVLLSQPIEEAVGPVQNTQLTNIVAGLIGAWVALLAILLVAFWVGIFLWRLASD
jgi:hypothetical protein